MIPEPTKDADGYPSDESLKIIEKWDLVKRPVYELLDFAEPLWEYPDRFVRTHRTLYLSTGGWSGNESIVEALQKNFIFWMMYWFKTQRGGHYWFNRGMISKTMPGFLGTKKQRLVLK